MGLLPDFYRVRPIRTRCGILSRTTICVNRAVTKSSPDVAHCTCSQAPSNTQQLPSCVKPHCLELYIQKLERPLQTSAFPQPSMDCSLQLFIEELVGKTMCTVSYRLLTQTAFVILYYAQLQLLTCPFRKPEKISMLTPCNRSWPPVYASTPIENPYCSYLSHIFSLFVFTESGCFFFPYTIIMGFPSIIQFPHVRNLTCRSSPFSHFNIRLINRGRWCTSSECCFFLSQNLVTLDVIDRWNHLTNIPPIQHVVGLPASFISFVEFPLSPTVRFPSCHRCIWALLQIFTAKTSPLSRTSNLIWCPCHHSMLGTDKQCSFISCRLNLMQILKKFFRQPVAFGQTYSVQWCFIP